MVLLHSFMILRYGLLLEAPRIDHPIKAKSIKFIPTACQVETVGILRPLVQKRVTQIRNPSRNFVPLVCEIFAVARKVCEESINEFV